MEEYLESGFGYEDDYELGNININVNEPQQPEEEDKENNYLACD